MSVTDPVKPARRAASTARRPASEAPTTTSRSTDMMASSILDEGERLGRAAGHGGAHRFEVLVVDVAIGQQLQLAGVGDLEDRRRQRLAHAEADALHSVDD